MSYNTDFIVHYTNNTEYRKQFRALFNMIAQNQDDDIDEETLDEQNYDNKQSTIILDHIYSITKDNTYFIQMYADAAALMMSADPEIGLAVLFSYDYFATFHQCLCDFIKTPMNMNDKNPFYISVKNKIKV